MQQQIVDDLYGLQQIAGADGIAPLSRVRGGEGDRSRAPGGSADFSQGRFRLEKTILFCISVNLAPRWRHNAKKLAQEGPSGPPRGLQESPRGPQEGPCGPQEGPKTAPRRPRMAPRGPKRAPRGPKRAPEGPKRAPRGPKRPQVSPRMTHLDVKWRFPFLVLKGFSGGGRFGLEKK